VELCNRVHGLLLSAVANGVVYVGSDDSNVYALNASNGAKLWSFATAAGVESSPAVVNGTVYVGSEDSNVYAIGNGAAATSHGIPGFDVTLALVGLIIIAYALKRSVSALRPLFRYAKGRAETPRTCMNVLAQVLTWAFPVLYINVINRIRSGCL